MNGIEKHFILFLPLLYKSKIIFKIKIFVKKWKGYIDYLQDPL